MIKWSVFSLFRNLMVIMTSVLKMFFSFYWLYKGKQLKQVKATLYTSYLSHVYPLLCTVYTCFYSYNKVWICGLHPKEEKLSWLFYFVLLASPNNQKKNTVIKLKGRGHRNNWGQLQRAQVEKKECEMLRMTKYKKRG